MKAKIYRKKTSQHKIKEYNIPLGSVRRGGLRLMTGVDGDGSGFAIIKG